MVFLLSCPAAPDPESGGTLRAFPLRCHLDEHLAYVFLYAIEVRRVWMTTLVLVAVFAQSTIARADRANAREHVRVGQTLAAAGAVVEALEHYEKAIESDPDLGEAYEFALPLWLSQKAEPRAIAALEKLTLRCPTCGFAWYALGALYRRVQRFDLAVMAYEVYLSRHPRDAAAVFGLGMACSGAGDERALEVFERYVAMETRPERAAFLAEAQRRALSLGGPGTPQLSPAVRAQLNNIAEFLAPVYRTARALLRAARPSH